MKKYLGPSKFLAVVVFIPVFIGCKDKIIPPVIDGDYSLCYEKSYNGHWEIFTNNITGIAPKDISNYSGDDEYPQWSPDGRYIVYSRRSGIVAVVVYDTKTQANTVLTTDSVDAGLTPHWTQWTPNGKMSFYCRSLYDVYDPGATYIMNPDGSQKKKILNFGAKIYFYNDSYNFLYIVDSEKVYKSNIDNTITEFLFDIQQILHQFVAIQGFNSNTEEFLITLRTTDSVSAVATYGVRTRNLNILLTAEEGYTFFQVKYSKDFSKIALVEHSRNDEYLSVLENGVKKRLVRIAASTPLFVSATSRWNFRPMVNITPFPNKFSKAVNGFPGQSTCMRLMLLLGMCNTSIKDFILHGIPDHNPNGAIWDAEFRCLSKSYPHELKKGDDQRTSSWNAIEVLGGGDCTAAAQWKRQTLKTGKV